MRTASLEVRGPGERGAGRSVDKCTLGAAVGAGPCVWMCAHVCSGSCGKGQHPDTQLGATSTHGSEGALSLGQGWPQCPGYKRGLRAALRSLSPAPTLRGWPMPPARIFRGPWWHPCLSHPRQGLFFYGLGIPNRPWPPSHPHLGELFIPLSLYSLRVPSLCQAQRGPQQGQITAPALSSRGRWTINPLRKRVGQTVECREGRGGGVGICTSQGWLGRQGVWDVGAAWRTARGPVVPRVAPSQTGGTGQRG